MPDSIHFLDHAIAGAFVGNEEAGTSLIDRSPAPPFAQRRQIAQRWNAGRCMFCEASRKFSRAKVMSV